MTESQLEQMWLMYGQGLALGYIAKSLGVTMRTLTAALGPYCDEVV